ncbi:MAG: cadmium-translocating P-type ATPase, partial [Candidatus Sumerlaeia bacterium]|nr:cadmium-translocating P-type ATPase [Candidatus Sumerlaeia bacterium]
FGASKAMEEYARARTHRSIEELTRDMPRFVTTVECGKQREIAVDDLHVGALVVIRPGERVPLDCVVVEGESDSDLSAMTGESEPLAVRRGVELPSGAVNGRGRLMARVLRPARESAWQKIIRLVENAPARRSPAEVLSERVGRIFTVVILLASGVGFLAWWLLAGLDAGTAAYRAMVLLVAGSPCAIVLSIPSAILAAIASGARRGILFNGGIGLYAIGRARTVAFDKTGTLSTGEPGVLKVSGTASADAELLAATLELARSSTHPASRAVERHLRGRHIEPAGIQLDQVSERPGHGISARWRGCVIALGRAGTIDGDGGDGDFSRSVVSLDDEEMIRFHLSETPREGARETVAALARRGLRPMVLSGDHQGAVNRMARSIGIDDARGGLAPDEKWKIVSGEAERGGIIMVGDGVNDAPALTAATAGVAMGIRGSAATLAQADIILAKDRLFDLVEAWELGGRTRAIIRQNLVISIGAASIMVITAAFGALPLLAGVIGHEGGTVLVVLNSLRLLLPSGSGSDRPSRNTAPVVMKKPAVTPGH